MKTIFIVALVAISRAAAYHLGIQDTPEVAHAKAEHFAAVEKAKIQLLNAGGAGKSLWTTAQGQSQWGSAQGNTWEVPHYAPAVKYHGPIALPPGYDKHGAPLPVLDTPEVAHAKAAHMSAVAKAGGHIYPAVYHTPMHYGGYESWSSGPQQTQQYAAGHIRYHGPIALPPGYDKHGAPLPVMDTPEVAAEKSKHFQMYAKTLANLGPIGGGLHHHYY